MSRPPLGAPRPKARTVPTSTGWPGSTLPRRAGSSPPWLDAVLGKALSLAPGKRQETVSEFAHDLKSPGRQFQQMRRPPLIERDPVLFWKCLSLLLAVTVVALIFPRSQAG